VAEAREPRLRAIIVDDDVMALRRLRDLLGAHPDIEIVRECGDGIAAVEAIRATPADIVFLDVQMPGLDGFQVVAAVGAAQMPPVVFTSAYAEFAVRAFEAYALDYILKPFDDERFEAALGRVRPRLAAIAPAADAGLDARLLALVEHLRAPATARYPEAIAVKAGAQYVVVRVADVDWIEADGNYSKLYVQKRPRLLAKSLVTLEKDVLDPERFVRVHRSAIVNVAKIIAVEPHFHGEVVLVLYDGTHVDCSRRHRKHLEERLYFTT